jgi:hypothetical protein
MLGCALLLYGGHSLGFTLIELPPEQSSPSSSVTETTTLKTQVQPIAGAIHTQMLNLRRHKRSRNVAQFGRVLVASAEADGRGGFGPLAAALKEPAAAGGASGGGAATGLWISATANSLENEFSRTAFDGASHNLLAGFDVTHSNRYVFGLAVGHEASNYTTTFNVGNEKTRGFNVTPYVAFLLSDSWSLDLSGGYGDFDTRQTRTVGSIVVPLATVAVNSEFSSTREFAAANLTNISTWGNWTLTGSLGMLAARRKNDAYTETDGTAVAASKQTSEQWSLLGEAAYARGASEAFLGVMYERAIDPVQVQFATGAQPANDPDSYLVSAGWRHFGKDLIASFAFTSRLSLDQVKEYGFSMTLRVGL